MNCVATEAKLRFSVRGFGYALFLVWGKNMKKASSLGKNIAKGCGISVIIFILIFAIIVALALLLPENDQSGLENGQTGTENESEQTNTESEDESEIVLKPSPISFINRTYEIDYVGGVQWTFEIKNNSEKEIKYVTLEWSCCDSVGEPIYDNITGKNLVGYKFPGPWESGETKRYQTPNTSKFYNHAYAQSKLVTIKVEFMDGEIVDITSKEYTDIFKTTSLDIPTLPYTISTDTDQPYLQIIDIEYEFVDINSSFVSGDGKKITNDFTYNITCVYQGQEDRLQCEMGWRLIDSNGNIVYSNEDVSTIINSESKKFSFYGQCVDVINPGETYTLEVYYIKSE